MQTAFYKKSFELRAKPIQVISNIGKFTYARFIHLKMFCNIPKLGKHEHTKTFKILNNNESQFLLEDKVKSEKSV